MIVFPVKTIKENAVVSPLFGKAKYFAFYDGKELIIESNPFQKGTKLIDWFIEKKVDMLIIKEIGSKSFKRTIHSNIKIFYAGEDNVTTNELIEKYNSNKLEQLREKEIEKIIEKHEHNKKSSSCKAKDHNDSQSKLCYKKMKLQNPNVFV